MPPLHEPQLPPQPLSPHCLPAQLGVQLQCPPLQVEPGAQLPQLPLQPLEPQFLPPLQSGAHWQPLVSKAQPPVQRTAPPQFAPRSEAQVAPAWSLPSQSSAAWFLMPSPQ